MESTEPPTPHNLIVSDRAESDEEDDEEDQFSLDDIVTDPEDEEEQNDAQEEKVEGVPGEGEFCVYQIFFPISCLLYISRKFEE